VDIVTNSFRHAESILKEPEFSEKYLELIEIIKSISDEEIIAKFNTSTRNAKSISEAVNNIIKTKLTSVGWMSESPIFQDSGYLDKRWRLDFAGHDISIEVAFNHGEAIAWNLLKPVIASELNHVKKAIQTKIGIIICATEEMKIAGGFDAAIGEFEKFLTYLNPLRNVLTVPILIIGLKKPETFKIVWDKVGNNNVGRVVYI
jgi:hypothetical protein